MKTTFLIALVTWLPFAPFERAGAHTVAASFDGFVWEMERDQAERRGCCSHHGGVCGCRGGRALCCDGRVSPSCGCD